MGANFVSYRRFGTRDEIKVWFEREQEQDRYENGHCYSGGIGMARGIRFVEATVFDDERQAEEWICDHAEKWEAAIAVPLRKRRGDGTPAWMIGAWCSS
jgi:hypothetical protein